MPARHATSASRGEGVLGLLLVWIVASLSSAFAQQPSNPLPAAPPPGPPVLTISPASSGAFIQSYSGGSASMDLGRFSYFGAMPAAGTSLQKSAGSLVISTRFLLTVNCPGKNSSTADIAVFLADASSQPVFFLDGIRLSHVSQPLTVSQPCGSSTEHTLEMTVPATAPAGPIAETLNFTVTRKDK